MPHRAARWAAFRVLGRAPVPARSPRPRGTAILAPSLVGRTSRGTGHGIRRARADARLDPDSKQRDYDGILKSACENFEIFRKAGDMDRAAGCLRILSMTADKILSTLAPPEPVQTERVSDLSCSFCGRSGMQARLAAGPDVYICECCVADLSDTSTSSRRTRAIFWASAARPVLTAVALPAGGQRPRPSRRTQGLVEGREWQPLAFRKRQIRGVVCGQAVPDGHAQSLGSVARSGRSERKRFKLPQRDPDLLLRQTATMEGANQDVAYLVPEKIRRDGTVLRHPLGDGARLVRQEPRRDDGGVDDDRHQY